MKTIDVASVHVLGIISASLIGRFRLEISSFAGKTYLQTPVKTKPNTIWISPEIAKNGRNKALNNLCFSLRQIYIQ